MEMRVEIARELEKQGVRVDWRKHDLLALIELQIQTDKSWQSLWNKTAANPLNRGGGDNQ